jgi:hypothetical protein
MGGEEWWIVLEEDRVKNEDVDGMLLQMPDEMRRRKRKTTLMASLDPTGRSIFIPDT